MRTAYLAGSITGLDYKGATDWRQHAVRRLGQHGILGLSPMRGKAFLKDVESFSATCEAEGYMHPMATPRGIMTRDRNDAMTCDVLLVNLLGAAKVSIGTVMEIAWADSVRTPIVCAIEDTGNVHEHAMIDQALGYRVPNLDQAIDIVIAIVGGRR